MKRKSVFIVSLLVLLIGIPTGLLLHQLHRDRMNRELFQAIKQHDTSAALWALRHGADPNATDYPSEKTPSLRAQAQQWIAHLFHPSGPPSSNLHPPALLLLLNSTQQIDPKLVDALLTAGADPNAVDSDGDTPLTEAPFSGGAPCIRLLLAHGADIRHKTKEGRTALHQAARSDVGSIQALLAAGADLQAKDNQGLSPLHHAYDNMRADTALFLIQHHADIHARDAGGGTPLHTAAWHCNADMIAPLLAAGADIDARDNDGWTPLHCASSFGNADTVELLLRHHADPTLRNLQGKTPLDVAKSPPMAQLTIPILEAALKKRASLPHP